MKERIIDEMYIATAYPIISEDAYGYRRGRAEESFIVNPILRKNIFGKERIVGAVETVSKTKLFSCYYDDDAMGWKFCDVEERTVGGILWDTNWYERADLVLKEDILDQYLSQTPEEAAQRLADVRSKYKELVKTDKFNFSRVMKK